MKTQTKEKDTCLNPKCNNTASSRGLCHSCYGQAGALVRRKLTTWADLEKAGRCLPAHSGKMIVGTKDWLLKKEEPTEPTA